MDTMKAIGWTKYGSPDVLQHQEVEKPTRRDNEMLIRVHAATVTAGDCELRRFAFPVWLWLPIRLWLGFRRPRKAIPGQELAGEVEAVG
jgi:NADPH:quinone reductase-like Zn-dependent oxidoreductase